MSAFSRALTAREAFILRSIAYPTIRFEQTSFTAHTYSLPSPVQCSVMSVSQTSSRDSAVKFRSTKSSPTGAPGFRYLPFFRVMTDLIPAMLHNRQTLRSDTRYPSSCNSSARNRYPSSGSSACSSRNTLMRCSSSTSRRDLGCCNHL